MLDDLSVFALLARWALLRLAIENETRVSDEMETPEIVPTIEIES